MLEMSPTFTFPKTTQGRGGFERLKVALRKR